MSVSLREVEAALDSVPTESGVIVAHEVSPGRYRRLAYREPLPGGGAVLVVLGVEGHGYPTRPRVRADARRRPDPPREGREAGSRADPPTLPGTLGPERPEDPDLLSADGG